MFRISDRSFENFVCCVGSVYSCFRSFLSDISLAPVHWSLCIHWPMSERSSYIRSISLYADLLTLKLRHSGFTHIQTLSHPATALFYPLLPEAVGRFLSITEWLFFRIFVPIVHTMPSSCFHFHCTATKFRKADKRQ